MITRANIYRNDWNDDFSHMDVVAARVAGRDWAEREWDALNEDAQREQAESSGWISTARDALPLVDFFGPESDLEDTYERRAELSEICNLAAEEKWDQICTELIKMITM